MKKLLIIVAVLISSYSYGQWDFISHKQKVIVNQSVITVNSNKLEFLFSYGKMYLFGQNGKLTNSFVLLERYIHPAYDGVGWMCKDEDGIYCFLIFIIHSDNTKEIILVYPDFIIKYK